MTKNKICALVLGLLISISVFSEGMYRDGSQFVFMILVSVLFAVCVFVNGVDIVPRSLLDWFVVVCIPVYIIASFDAVSLWDAIASVARYICCYMIYYLGKSVLFDNKHVFYRVIYYIGTISCIYGLCRGITGEAYEAKRGLLLSVFGYHNASAVYFAVLFILGMYIASKRNSLERILVSVCNSLLAFSIIFTQSRGTWLVFVVCVLLNIILSFYLEKEHQDIKDFIRKINELHVMRNEAAHTLSVVSLNNFKQIISPEKVIEMFEKILMFIYPDIKKEYFNSYELVNEEIINLIK